MKIILPISPFAGLLLPTPAAPMDLLYKIGNMTDQNIELYDLSINQRKKISQNGIGVGSVSASL